MAMDDDDHLPRSGSTARLRPRKKKSHHTNLFIVNLYSRSENNCDGIKEFIFRQPAKKNLNKLGLHV